MISVRDGWLSICGKNLRADFLGHYCQTLHDGITRWALLIHTTFSDFDCISRAQQCQTVLTENFMFFSDYVETAIVDYVKIMNTTIFFFSHIFKGDNWHVSSFKKTITLAFSDITTARSFQLCITVLLIKLYLFIPLSMILTLFQGCSNVEQF